MELFNTPGPVENLNCSELSFWPLDNDLSQRIHTIINWIRQTRSTYQEILILKQNDPMEPTFFLYLLEDKSHDTMSYVDFLVHVHRQIQTKLS